MSLSSLSVHDCIKRVMSELEQSESASLEAELLVGLALNSSRSFLHAWPDEKIDEMNLVRLQSYLARRKSGEPMAYIMGYKEFWSLKLEVNCHTLVPRPETEILIEKALAVSSKQDKMCIADLGTGSGAIALALASERPNAIIHASDICHDALAVANRNKAQLQLENVTFFHGDWCAALPCFDYDMLVSNPPYISENEWPNYQNGLTFEPKHALLSGSDGLYAIRLICQQACRYLKPYGYLLIEHGFLQGEAVRMIFASMGFGHVETIRDLSSHERVTIGRRCLD
jgi:release factor glutamine methyltransferase